MTRQLRHNCVVFTAAGIWDTLKTSSFFVARKLEELDRCDFTNGSSIKGPAGCSHLQTKLWKGTLGAGGECHLRPAGVLGSAPAVSPRAHRQVEKRQETQLPKRESLPHQHAGTLGKYQHAHG